VPEGPVKQKSVPLELTLELPKLALISQLGFYGRYRIGHLNMRLIYLLALVSIPVALPNQARSHPGGLNGEGCHNNRKTGDYHCHRGGGARKSSTAPNRAYAALGSTYYRNCTAARAAGAAPVRVGDAGYARHLDRDGDGVGCE